MLQKVGSMKIVSCDKSVFMTYSYSADDSTYWERLKRVSMAVELGTLEVP
jgi:hypothetical protein